MTMSHYTCVYLPHDYSHNPELEELTAKTQLTETFVGISRFRRNETPDVRECPKDIFDRICFALKISQIKILRKITAIFILFFS